MRQEVNLYREEFRRQDSKLDLNRAGKYLLGLLLILGLVSAYMARENRQLDNELTAAQQTRDELLTRVTRLSEAAGSQDESGELARQLEQRQQELSTRRAVLGFLEDSEVGNESGFSQYLTGIANAYDEEMRITAVGITAGGAEVSLAGEVVEAEAVPLFLQRLARETVFRGKSFETVRIGSNDEDGMLEFSAATSAEQQ